MVQMQRRKPKRSGEMWMTSTRERGIDDIHREYWTKSAKPPEKYTGWNTTSLT